MGNSDTLDYRSVYDRGTKTFFDKTTGLPTGSITTPQVMDGNFNRDFIFVDRNVVNF
jgi:hypothetical protein